MNQGEQMKTAFGLKRNLGTALLAGALLWGGAAQAAFKDTLQGAMGMGDVVFFSNALNRAQDELGDRKVGNYAYSGIAEVGKSLENDPIVRRFLTSK